MGFFSYTSAFDASKTRFASDHIATIGLEPHSKRGSPLNAGDNARRDPRAYLLEGLRDVDRKRGAWEGSLNEFKKRLAGNAGASAIYAAFVSDGGVTADEFVAWRNGKKLKRRVIQRGHLRLISANPCG
jgi:hypothetical protein